MLTIYIMLWTLGICASYAFVMTVVKKDAPLLFLRRSSLLALLSYGVAWFFGVLYYIHPDTVARFAKLAPPSTNVWLQTFFAQSREYVFLSFVLIPILAATLSVITFSMRDNKRHMMPASIALTIFGTIAILLAMMIA
ncbi:MAG: DUF2499 domain-containing protein [Parcubacteria group bacterium]|nr:DUF2499 domain-containing protein [Parcubacteria group bacterium]